MAVPLVKVIGLSEPSEGETSFTVIEIVVDPEPPELVAVIVASVSVCSVEGVPVIAPVPELIVSPDGNPVADHDVTGPPELDGAVMDTTEPRVKVCAEMVPITGIGWTTAKENDFESVPA